MFFVYHLVGHSGFQIMVNYILLSGLVSVGFCLVSNLVAMLCYNAEVVAYVS